MISFNVTARTIGANGKSLDIGSYGTYIDVCGAIRAYHTGLKLAAPRGTVYTQVAQGRNVIQFYKHSHTRFKPELHSIVLVKTVELPDMPDQPSREEVQVE